MNRDVSRLSEQFRCVALSELQLDRATDAQHESLSRFGPVITQRLDSWHDAFKWLQPLRTFPRHYVVAGFGDWSLVLCDTIGESCLVDVLFHSRLSHCRAVGGVALPFERRFFYISGGEVLRDVECFREDHWRFREKGDPLSIEHSEFYESRTRSKRLPEHSVLEYVSAMTGVAFPLNFQATPPRLVGFERSWHQLRQPPEEVNVVDDLGATN